MCEILVEKYENGVALVRVNRPEALNALNMATRQKLAEAFKDLSSDEKILSIVITGDRKAFAAGADLKEMAQVGPIEMMLRNMDLLWKPVADCPKPLIAAVNGYALGGGCELAMHADIIIAGHSAQFGQPEIKVGIMPGAGGTQRLTRAVGKYKAMKLLMTGGLLNAADAFDMGLVSEVVADEEVLSSALKLAGEIAGMPPLALKQIKEVVLAGQDSSLSTALMLERKALQLLFDSEDQKEGMNAFIEKRKPVYKGR